MLTINASHIQRLIEIEAQVHYGELPPPGINPFVYILRDSPIVLSAPHGARTFRNNATEIWHEEDEYTAGMALLLSELCQTSVIATIWRTEESDPNEHGEKRSTYKNILRHLVQVSSLKPAWLIDLHGASEDSNRMADMQKVDLGTGKKCDYLPVELHHALKETLEKRLDKGATDRNGKPGFDADDEHRIAAFAHKILHLSSVQIEMKPSVRIPLRRIDASMYSKSEGKFSGPYSADQKEVIALLQALVDFIEYLKTPKSEAPSPNKFA
jgi:hypothetical protein